MTAYSTPLPRRALLLASLLLVPFLSFLIRNGYSLLRPESLVLSLWLAAVSALLAWPLRSPRLFLPLFTLLSAIQFASLLRRLTAFALSPWAAFFASLVLAASLVWMLRGKAVHAIAASSSASLLAACFSLAPPSPPASLPSPSLSPAPHSLHLILDEQTGLAGFPSHIPACRLAAARFLSVLTSHRFTVHPNAYSNYPITIASVSSALNGTLLPGSRHFIRVSTDGANRFALTRNQLLSSAPTSLSPVVYQHGAIDLTAGIPAAAVSYEDSLADLQLPPGPWHTKALWLIGRYQASDRIASVVNSFFPFRTASRGTGPLSVRKIWPLPLALHIARTNSPSLFLVHLMSPHSPYLYRPSGELRPMPEWAADRPDRRLSPAAYDAAYHRYCQQSEHLASELDTFLASLSASGALDAMHIVIHGDHGSRIRRQLPSSLPRSSPESFDYSAPPPLPDLLDRFSILYATRLPHSPSANIIPTRQSLLRLLAGYLHRPPLAPGPSDDVYLFDPSGAPRPIPILNYWK